MKARQKLIWLGLKRPAKNRSNVAGIIDLLKENVGDFGVFQTETGNQTSFSEFKTYLKNEGLTQDQVDRFVDKINNNFTDEDSSGTTWDEWEDFILNTADNYQDVKSRFGNSSYISTELESEDGSPAAGIRVFENKGVTSEGYSVPAGSVEIFGREIHYSKSGTTKSDAGSGSTGGEATFTVSNITTDDADNELNVYQTVTISADVTNNGSYEEFYTATLTEDDTSIDNEYLRIAGGATETVSFKVAKAEYACHDYRIGNSSSVYICWTPTGVTY